MIETGNVVSCSSGIQVVEHIVVRAIVDCRIADPIQPAGVVIGIETPAVFHRQAVENAVSRNWRGIPVAFDAVSASLEAHTVPDHARRRLVIVSVVHRPTVGDDHGRIIVDQIKSVIAVEPGSAANECISSVGGPICMRTKAIDIAMR